MTEKTTKEKLSLKEWYNNYIVTVKGYAYQKPDKKIKCTKKRDCDMKYKYKDENYCKLNGFCHHQFNESDLIIEPTQNTTNESEKK